ncbi:MAG: hypothetical protein O3A30_03870 [Bacteroidetes bacterium]|nr:hypothetical protein [Bacteroidota bacterium]
MAQKFVTNLDLNQNQLLNGRFESVATDPNTNNFEGRLIYNSTEKVLKVYDGTAWRKAIHALSSTTTALVISESNGSVTFSIADAVASGASGLLNGTDKQALDNKTSSNTGSTIALRDAAGRLQVSAPVNDLDAANKSYVDAARTGLDVKASVRAATTGALSITTDLEAGDTIDNVTLVAGDRVLVKNQASASENGIYVVQASGAAVRATDADSADEVTPGMFTFVEEGDENADSGWVLTNNGTITLGTTGLDFALFSVAGTILAGDGLSKTGDVLNVNVASDGGIEIASDNLQIKVDSNFDGLTTTVDGLALDSNIAGTGITFTAGVLSTDTIDLTSASGNGVSGLLPIANGGTNASTEADARDNLAATSATGLTTSTPTLARISAQTIGNGADATFSIVHNFGTRDVTVQVYDSSTYDTVITDVVRTNANQVDVSFSVAPASGAYRVVVSG